ncbi:MAG: HAMP domain-containing sensor histidine kinase [Myxococcota bacterium]
MRLPRLSSFLTYALVALTAVLVPPSAGLVRVTLAVEQLAETGSRTVLDAATTADLARSLAEHVSAMERLARQRRTLGDDALAPLYEARRQEFVDTVARLDALPLAPDVRARLVRLRTAEAAVHAGLSGDPAAPAYDAALTRFGDLAGEARGILAAASQAIAEAATALRDDAQALEHRLVGAAVWLVPLVGGLLVVAVVLIVRPLRHLDLAIRRLGAGDLERPIRIYGPADLRDLGARLEWLRERLLAEESDRVRLLRHVSHELKTPLTCIREGGQLLSDGVAGDLSAEQRELVGIIGTNAEALGRRIEDLLRASELRQEGATLDLRPVRLDQVVREVLHQSAVAMRARGITLREALAPVEVRGDGPRLRTVVDNLVTNAVKFSPEGGALDVTLAATPEGVVLAVEDEGPGVDPAERDAVFESFYQGRASLTHNVAGTGLGLSIAREYVRAHGGDVHMEAGRVGARVVVRLGRRA